MCEFDCEIEKSLWKFLTVSRALLAIPVNTLFFRSVIPADINKIDKVEEAINYSRIHNIFLLPIYSSRDIDYSSVL